MLRNDGKVIQNPSVEDFSNNSDKITKIQSVFKTHMNSDLKKAPQNVQFEAQ